MMATAAIDIDRERSALKRQLIYAKRDRDLEALKVRSGTGDEEQLGLLRSKVKRIEYDLAELDGARELQQEDQLRAAEAEKLRKRGIAALEYRETLSDLRADAAELAGYEVKLRAVTARIEARLDRAHELRHSWLVGEGQARENRVWTLAERFSGKRIDLHLRAFACRVGLIPAEPAAAGMDVVEGISNFADQALAEGLREFPELGEI